MRCQQEPSLQGRRVARLNVIEGKQEHRGENGHAEQEHHRRGGAECAGSEQSQVNHRGDFRSEGMHGVTAQQHKPGGEPANGNWARESMSPGEG